MTGDSDYFGAGDVDDVARLHIWAAVGALRQAAPYFRREVESNPIFQSRLTRLASRDQMLEEDRLYWSDLLRGNHSRARGRSAGVADSANGVAVSGSLLREAAKAPAVQEIIALLEQAEQPISSQARELLAELFAGKFVRSAGQPPRTVNEVRTVGEAYESLRAKVESTEEAYHQLGKRFKIHPRVVQDYVREWQGIASYVGPRVQV